MLVGAADQASSAEAFLLAHTRPPCLPPLAPTAAAISGGGPNSSKQSAARAALMGASVAGGAGVLAGMVAVGGGTMIAPVLLEFGVHPQVCVWVGGGGSGSLVPVCRLPGCRMFQLGPLTYRLVCARR